MTLSRIFIAAAAILLVVSLAGAFSLLGTPAHQRRLAEDTARVSDLRAIAQSVQSRGVTPPPVLPSSAPSQFAVAAPIPTADVSYRRLDNSHFELCTVFNEPAPDDAQNPNYGHPAGRTCYRYEMKQGFNAQVPQRE